MDSYMASNKMCFMVTWTIFKNRLLEVGLTKNYETMALRTFTTGSLLCFMMCEDPHEHKFIEIAFGWGSGHMWLHTTLEDPLPHSMILEVCLDSLWTLSFGLSQFHGHNSCLVCEVALRCWCEVNGPYMVSSCCLLSKYYSDSRDLIFVCVRKWIWKLWGWSHMFGLTLG